MRAMTLTKSRKLLIYNQRHVTSTTKKKTRQLNFRVAIHSFAASLQ